MNTDVPADNHAVVETFGHLLRRARRAAQLSQEELAERAGISARAISDLERGVNRVPRRDTLDMLAEALNVEPERRRQWERARRAGAVRSAPERSPDIADSSTLPSPLTSLLGRDEDVAAVRSLLAVSRLVTLVGPGGVGKTRLALEILRRAGDDHPDGVHFVSLAAIRDPGLVLSSIAQSLGVTEQAGRTIAEALSARFAGHRVLLGLDNLEQVVEAGPELAALLEQHPGLTILATSRAPLRVRGEQLFPVAPLAAPSGGESSNTATLIRFPAVGLFVQQAAHADPAFTLTDDNAAAIADICRRLDGLPLAIELAAARVTTLTPRMVLDRLEHPLSLLTGGARDVPDRQQTMRATIEWSYDLLSPGEQRLFRLLSVFVGGWTLEAAEAVAAGDDEHESNALDGLVSLVHGSLVTRDAQPDGGTRFSMLEPIREFGLERLTRDDELGAARQRHADYVMQLVRSGEHGLLWQPRETPAWMQRFETEHDNIRAALGWLQQTEQVEGGLQLIGVAALFWNEAGHLTEGRRWIETFLSHGGDVSEGSRMKVLRSSGMMATWQGDFDFAERRLHESSRFAHALGDKLTVGIVALGLGINAAMRPDPDTIQARTYFEQTLAISRDLGLYRGITVALNNLGVLARDEGDDERAISLFQEALRVAREQHDVLWMEGPLGNLGWISLKWGNSAQALDYFREALRVSGDGQRPQFILGSVQGVAEALLAGGQAERCLRLLGAVRSIRERSGAIANFKDHAEYDDVVATARAQLNSEVAALAWRAGRAMSIHDAIADALAARL